MRSNSPLFSGLPVEFDIGLYHSWAVQDENFPEELKIIAMCDENVVMAMQHKFYRLWRPVSSGILYVGIR
ncbi:putative anthranilate synthase component II [Rodentibacter pneumotropicus]|uniref:Putative anthranilate synthase component II n=1 Tax=Rodentibacter pneumotropicus TaxID=758 RepID=A0A448MMY7_9PAST|nr:putative anthranilate synthase component II [Rodentibacter pneumotropicus]